MSSEQSEKLNNLKWFSLTNFVDEIKKMKLINVYLYSIKAYFKKCDIFVNKYNKICIKPIILVLDDGVDKTRIIKHAEILEMFDGQPVITCSSSKKRYVPTDDSDYCLFMRPVLCKYNNYNYYPSKVISAPILPKILVDDVRVKNTTHQNETD